MTPLSDNLSGKVRCFSIEGEGAEVVRLKRLGICAGQTVRIVQAGDPMILEVVGSRVGLSRQLASRVIVEPMVHVQSNSSQPGGVNS